MCVAASLPRFSGGISTRFLKRRCDVESSLSFPSPFGAVAEIFSRGSRRREAGTYGCSAEESGCPCHSLRQQGLAVGTVTAQKVEEMGARAGFASASLWPLARRSGGKLWGAPRLGSTPSPDSKQATVTLSLGLQSVSLDRNATSGAEPGLVPLRSPSVSAQQALRGVGCKASSFLGGVIIKIPRIPAENEAHTSSRGKEPGSC